MSKEKMKVGDLVRVRQAGGRLSDQRYEVVDFIASAGRGPDIIIRQWPSTAPKGKVMAGEPYTKSLLVVDNSGPRLLADLFPRSR